MKSFFIIFVTILCLFTSCKKEPSGPTGGQDPVKKEIDATYRYTIDYYDTDWIPIAYCGDTIKYDIAFTSEKNIKEIKVFITTANGDKYDVYPNSVEDSLQTKLITINNKQDKFTYIYPLNDDINSDRFSYIYYDVNGFKQETSFIFEYYDSTSLVQVDTLPSFYLSPLEYTENLRLYNIAADYGHANGYSYNINFLNNHIIYPDDNCENCILPDDEKLFMVNIPNIKNNIISKEFIKSWYAPNDNHFFVKLTQSYDINKKAIPTPPDFDAITTTNQIFRQYNETKPKISKVGNLKIGDIYAFRYIHTYTLIEQTETDPAYKYGDVFGIIEITDILDDNLTSDEGGSDLDYIEFKIKSFGMTCRFN